ncbi:hypothetical protein P152DRAFT_453137 [Eremomyces bilateralis CBS 781.70]|uniref:Uncharacterized protein n=1 Tax=Eremomyces bilateralis CBS 781.70 TaxID=1392243 RepID=A0A6G1FQX0_9PEZI|nr:uncharacterized protein P152DRAFT_453137 [Eremomyces bilateralis CBS 781.70]KAF1808128.1 hypothetical protein P152DRAFT_453137 [Eremomyces bilateralis CBS 781.70]
MDAAIMSEITGTDCHIEPFASSAAHTTPLRKASISSSLPSPSMEAPPTTFLCLVPVHSDSFPSSHLRSSSLPSPPALPSVPEQPIMLVDQQRRTSDSSTTSTGSALRFLKLGPVHFGGEPGVGDYADMD